MAKMVIATDRSYSVHPMEGILQIHFDQLNTIAKHLEDIKRDEEAARMATLPLPTHATVCMATPATPVEPAPLPEPPPEELAQTFTKKQLLKRVDWPARQQGIYKQLSQYPPYALALQFKSLWNQEMPHGVQRLAMPERHHHHWPHICERFRCR